MMVKGRKIYGTFMYACIRLLSVTETLANIRIFSLNNNNNNELSVSFLSRLLKVMRENPRSTDSLKYHFAWTVPARIDLADGRRRIFSEAFLADSGMTKFSSLGKSRRGSIRERRDETRWAVRVRYCPEIKPND